MKKLLAGVILCIPLFAVGQNHFKGSNYCELTAGISDQKTAALSIGFGHDLNETVSLNCKYGFSMPGTKDQYRFYHHTVDLYPKIVLHNFDDMWAINGFIGISQSLNFYSEIPRPNFNPHVYNLGYIAGIEYENMVNPNLAVYGSITNRGFFLDKKKHFELLYQIGVRLNTSIFSRFFN